MRNPGKVKGTHMMNLNEPCDIVCKWVGLEDMRLYDCGMALPAERWRSWKGWR